MLQFMGLVHNQQRVGYDLATEQQQLYKYLLQ